jgi:hypothetical protein
MVDIHSIIADHGSKHPDNTTQTKKRDEKIVASTSKIPDIFFDEIIVSYKLSRIDIIVLMYLYRRVWCKPNLFKVHGISPLLSHQAMADQNFLSIDDIYNAIIRLESLGFLSTIRSGQYFVRRYFTKENDDIFSQSYDDFET